MTNITGKIYQETNDDGTENRFPKTVVPAVIGLSQYLQDQFNTLSDLYMPKEGESESKTEQEISYRKSEATINAKTVTIDRIYGKTLAWNSLVQNGNFADTSEWDAASVVFSVSDGVCDIVANGQYGFLGQNVRPIDGHKYYFAFSAKVDASGNSYRAGLGGSSTFSGEGMRIDFGDAPTNAFARKARVGTFVKNQNDNSPILLFMDLTDTTSHFYIKDVVVIDLTLMFGAGNEPSTVAEFETMFPGYHDYNAGTLISNDAEALETVGFNVWDEEWINGVLNYNTGNVTGTQGAIASKNYIPVLSNTKYFRRVPSRYGDNSSFCRAAFYDANKNYLGGPTGMSNAWINFDGEVTFTTPVGASFMRFCLPVANYTNDICINLSDPAKNGTYEPYRKSTMQLGLDSIKVKSHNIWDEEWEAGSLNSNGQPTSGSCIRSKNYIPCRPNTDYYIAGSPVDYHFYDANYNHISIVGTQSATSPANAAYIKFRTSANYGTTYNYDICLNVSSSFNGQYEPHGILTIDGLKSAVSVQDELVGNKLIKRVGRVDLGTIDYTQSGDNTFFGLVREASINNNGRNFVCGQYIPAYKTLANLVNGEGRLISSPTQLHLKNSNYSSTASFKTAMSGVMLDYELATPIEYELAEPIVPTVKAGETEERVSPNSDGLSAPFCCDLTYNASETAGVLDALQGLSRKLELIEERLARLEDNDG